MREFDYTYLTDGSRDWGNGIIGPSLADELYVNYFLDHHHSSRPNLSALLPLAGLALAGCGTAVNSPSSPDHQSNSPAVTQPQDQNLGWQFPFWGRGYFTGGGGGVHGEHLDFSVAAGDCRPESTWVAPAAQVSPIRPMAPGIITLVGDENNPNDLNHSVVKIDHQNGYSTKYEHLAKIKIKKGQVVTYETELGLTSCEHSPAHYTTGPHIDVALIKDGKIVLFDETQPISGWVQHTQPGDRNGTLTKPGEETRVANSSWCEETNRNNSYCHNTINYLDHNPQETLGKLPNIPTIPSPTAFPTAQSSNIPIPTPTPAFGLRDEVVVLNTGNCLNIREQPSANGKVVDCQKDGSIMSVTGGPISADGYLWWQLNNTNKWAVQDYLQRYSRPYNPPEIPSPIPSSINYTNPSAVAEGFLQAAIRWDLNATREFFAPDKRPVSWKDIFFIAGGIDLSQCASVTHQSVVRAIGAFRLVNMIFSQGCVHPWEPVNENSAIGYYYIPKEHNVLSLPLEQANNRWYIVTSFMADRQAYSIHRAAQ